MTTVERFEKNIDQVNSDFQAIKSKLIECGIEVPDGTKTAEYAEKVGEVYNSGRKAEYDEFWDNFLDRTNLQQTTACLFAGRGWNEKTFNPPYYLDFLLDGYQLFLQCSYISKEKLAMIDYSKMNRLLGIFNSTLLIELPIIDARGATSLNLMCAWSNQLVSVEKIILKDDGSQTVTNAFQGCYGLQHLEIEGVIGQNGFNVSACTKLSKASILSILNALSTTTSGLTVTFSKEAVDNAFADGQYIGSESQEWSDWTSDQTDGRANWNFDLI